MKTSILSRWSTVIVAAGLGAVACSSTSSGAGSTPSDDTGSIADDTGGSTSGDSTDGDGALTSCGTNVGDVLCDVPVQGYLSVATTGLASSQPITTFNVSDVLAQGSQPYAFIFGTSFW